MSIDLHALQGIVRQRLVQLRLSHVTESTFGHTMTQSQLAAALGVTRATIANVENGRQNVSIAMLYRLAEVFGKDPRQLLPALDEVRVYDSDGAESTHNHALPASWEGAIDQAIETEEHHS